MPATLPAAPDLRRRSALAAVAALVAAIYVIETLVVRSPRFALRPQLFAGAVAFDLTLFVPFLWWLLVVRRGHARARTLLPVFLASLLGARLVLPVEQRGLLLYERLLVIPVELAIVAYVVIKVRRTARALRGASADLDVPERIAAALHDAFPNPIVGRMLATELTLGWYALASWRRAPHVPDGATAFSYHRRNGLVALLSTLAGVSVVELFVVHLVVHARSPRAAWTLTALSAVGVVWLVGFIRAIVLRPVLAYPDRLVVRGGVQWTVDVPRQAIARVESGRAVRAPAKGTPGFLRATPVAQPNVLLRLREEAEARGLYGRRRWVNLIALHVDDPAALALLLAESAARTG